MKVVQRIRSQGSGRSLHVQASGFPNYRANTEERAPTSAAFSDRRYRSLSIPLECIVAIGFVEYLSEGISESIPLNHIPRTSTLSPVFSGHCPVNTAVAAVETVQ